ncbi:hypothetical protein ACFSM5_02760 [Lacibacterium aquatile]|uniref:Copper resistance protein D domain-containing protein n=1 Tax=Lacibacterium aquatile TaxID=1168082 RepID=A0ABW5DMQ7_9PROT
MDFHAWVGVAAKVVIAVGVYLAFDRVRLFFRPTPDYVTPELQARLNTIRTKKMWAGLALIGVGAVLTFVSTLKL